MNRLEFNEVMKIVGINNPLSTTMGRYDSIEKVHQQNNIAIWFGGSYYTVVNGRIPLEVANIIYEKYPNNLYSIRVDGGCKGNKPIDWATDEMYEKEIEKYIDQGLNSLEFIAKCRTAKRNFKRRKNLDDKYIKTYHIDSKEGLLIFLIEMKNYYLRKNKLPETEVKKYDELIAKVSFIVLEKINPAISAYDWMQGGVKNRNIYNAALERDKKSEIGKMFRNALLNFDKAVNSFLNDSIEFDDMENYLNKLKITGDVYDYSDGEYREGCCYLKISNPEICSTTYYRKLN